MARSTLARVGLAAALAIVYVTSVAIGSEKSASAMATAAKAWLASLTAEQREQAAMPFDAADRTAWHYVPNEMFEEWQRRDPIDRYAERLVADYGFSTQEVEGIRSEVRAYVEECAGKALDSPMPDPALATDGVFADAWEPLGDGRAPWSRWSRTNGERSAA